MGGCLQAEVFGAEGAEGDGEGACWWGAVREGLREEVVVRLGGGGVFWFWGWVRGGGGGRV